MLILIPMAFIWAWNNCSVWALVELPEVDWMVKLRSGPDCGPELGWKYPSDAFLTPSPLSSDSALDGLTVSYWEPSFTYCGWEATNIRFPRGTMPEATSPTVWEMISWRLVP